MEDFTCTEAFSANTIKTMARNSTKHVKTPSKLWKKINFKDKVCFFIKYISDVEARWVVRDAYHKSHL